MVPGNSNFEKRIEYTTLVDYYLGRKAYVVFQVALNVCLQSLNIASIIIVAQVTYPPNFSQNFPPYYFLTPQNISMVPPNFSRQQIHL
jgi:hypothetical protein